MLILNFLYFLALIIQELVWETEKIENQPKFQLNINLNVILTCNICTHLYYQQQEFCQYSR